MGAACKSNLSKCIRYLVKILKGKTYLKRMGSNNIYSLCIASWIGLCDQGRHGEKDMCKIGMLDRDVEEHYQNLTINTHQLPVIYLTEKYLLENILFTEINENSVICPRHRDNQGIYWRPPARCLSALENKKCNSQWRVLPNYLLKHYIKSN